MKRREFIKLVVGSAVAGPLAARAQQRDPMRRIGILMALAADDPAGQARLVAFVQALQELSWTDGRNVRIDTRWAAGDAERFRRYAAELVALAPDVILASGGTGVGALLHATRTVSIVFTQTNDPVGAGYVDSLAQPGGNATGFTNQEYGTSGGSSNNPGRSRHGLRADDARREGSPYFGHSSRPRTHPRLERTAVGYLDVPAHNARRSAYTRRGNDWGVRFAAENRSPVYRPAN
jgi:hypothetical protein